MKLHSANMIEFASKVTFHTNRMYVDMSNPVVLYSNIMCDVESLSHISLVFSCNKILLE